MSRPEHSRDNGTGGRLVQDSTSTASPHTVRRPGADLSGEGSNVDGAELRPAPAGFSTVFDVQYVYGPEAKRLRQAQSDAIREVLECMAKSKNTPSKKLETRAIPGLRYESHGPGE